MTEALCGLIGNIKKEEKESEKKNDESSASCVQGQKALSVWQVDIRILVSSKVFSGQSRYKSFGFCTNYSDTFSLASGLRKIL